MKQSESLAKQLDTAVQAIKRNHPELKGPAVKLIREAIRHPEHAKVLTQVLEGHKRLAVQEKAVKNREALAQAKKPAPGESFGRMIADSVKRALEKENPNFVRRSPSSPLPYERDEKSILLNNASTPKKKKR